MIIDTIEFNMAVEEFDRSFPNAFTLINPEPKFCFNGCAFVLVEIEMVPVEDNAPVMLVCRAHRTLDIK